MFGSRSASKRGAEVSAPTSASKRRMLSGVLSSTPTAPGMISDDEDDDTDSSVTEALDAAEDPKVAARKRFEQMQRTAKRIDEAHDAARNKARFEEVMGRDEDQFFFHPLITQDADEWKVKYGHFKRRLRGKGTLGQILKEEFSELQRREFMQDKDLFVIKVQERKTKDYKAAVKTDGDGDFSKCHDNAITKLTMVYFGLPIEPLTINNILHMADDENCEPDDDAPLPQYQRIMYSEKPLEFLDKYHDRSFGIPILRRPKLRPQAPVPAPREPENTDSNKEGQRPKVPVSTANLKSQRTGLSGHPLIDRRTQAVPRPVQPRGVVTGMRGGKGSEMPLQYRLFNYNGGWQCFMHGTPEAFLKAALNLLDTSQDNLTSFEVDQFRSSDGNFIRSFHVTKDDYEKIFSSNLKRRLSNTEGSLMVVAPTRRTTERAPEVFARQKSQQDGQPYGSGMSSTAPGKAASMKKIMYSFFPEAEAGESQSDIQHQFVNTVDSFLLTAKRLLALPENDWEFNASVYCDGQLKAQEGFHSDMPADHIADSYEEFIQHWIFDGVADNKLVVHRVHGPSPPKYWAHLESERMKLASTSSRILDVTSTASYPKPRSPTKASQPFTRRAMLSSEAVGTRSSDVQSAGIQQPKPGRHSSATISFSQPIEPHAEPSKGANPPSNPTGPPYNRTGPTRTTAGLLRPLRLNGDRFLKGEVSKEPPQEYDPWIAEQNYQNSLQRDSWWKDQCVIEPGQTPDPPRYGPSRELTLATGTSVPAIYAYHMTLSDISQLQDENQELRNAVLNRRDKCTMCRVTFEAYKPEDIRKHMKKHAEDVASAGLCPFCRSDQWIFWDLTQKKDHLIKHQLMRETQFQQNFWNDLSCPLCEEDLSRYGAQDALVHMANHSPDANHFCDRCALDLWKPESIELAHHDEVCKSIGTADFGNKKDDVLFCTSCGLSLTWLDARLRKQHTEECFAGGDFCDLDGQDFTVLNSKQIHKHHLNCVPPFGSDHTYCRKCGLELPKSPGEVEAHNRRCTLLHPAPPRPRPGIKTSNPGETNRISGGSKARTGFNCPLLNEAGTPCSAFISIIRGGCEIQEHYKHHGNLTDRQTQSTLISPQITESGPAGPSSSSTEIHQNMADLKAKADKLHAMANKAGAVGNQPGDNPPGTGQVTTDPENYVDTDFQNGALQEPSEEPPSILPRGRQPSKRAASSQLAPDKDAKKARKQTPREISESMSDDDYQENKRLEKQRTTSSTPEKLKKKQDSAKPAVPAKPTPLKSRTGATTRSASGTPGPKGKRRGSKLFANTLDVLGPELDSSDEDELDKDDIELLGLTPEPTKARPKKATPTKIKSSPAKKIASKPSVAKISPSSELKKPAPGTVKKSPAKSATKGTSKGPSPMKKVTIQVPEKDKKRPSSVKTPSMKTSTAPAAEISPLKTRSGTRFSPSPGKKR